MREQQGIYDRLTFFIKRKILNLNFDSRVYWDMRYRHNWNSGTGSYGENAQAKAETLNKILAEKGIRSVVEFGHGDGNQLKKYKIEKYLGLDVSPAATAHCIEAFKDDPNKSFMAYYPDAFSMRNSFPKFEAAMSVDVIFHLVEKEVFEKYLKDLFSVSNGYVIIFSSNHNNNTNASVHVKHRKFTDFIEKNIHDWSLETTYECVTSSGQRLDDWFLFKKR